MKVGEEADTLFEVRSISCFIRSTVFSRASIVCDDYVSTKTYLESCCACASPISNTISEFKIKVCPRDDWGDEWRSRW